MYAVIETGGKQYRVEVGTELEVELLDAEAGSNITLDRVLLVADGAEAAIGRPVVADAAVEAEVVRRDRGDKVIAFKYRPKARRRVKHGHRQELTVLRIADIRFNGKSAADEVRKAEADRKSERQRLEEAAAKQAAADAALAAQLTKRDAKADADTATKGRASAKAGDTTAAPKVRRAKAGDTTSDTSKPATKPASRPRAKKDE
jgi:large subunit ribosomal protein L21